MFKPVATLVALVSIGSAGAMAAEQTWTGKLSDKMCGVSHETVANQAGISDRECAVECVKAGSKYVFVTQDKTVLEIANQDFTGLADHADHNIKLTGELKGDTITVSKIEMVAAAAK